MPLALRGPRYGATVAALAVVGLAGCAGAPTAVSPGASLGQPSPSVAAADARTVLIVLTDAGCPPVPATIPSGPLTFQIRNRDSTRVSEVELVQGDRILGEKEDLTPGLGGSFSLELAAGAYEIYCPGATSERSPFTVTAGSVQPTGAASDPLTDRVIAALAIAAVSHAS